MDAEDLPRPRGDAASKLAGESLDPYSVDELNTRIQLLEAEVVRIVAHRDKAKAHRGCSRCPLRQLQAAP